MAKDAIVSEELAKKFATEKDTPYLRWVRSEGLDVISAHYVRNLRSVELKPWARRGGSGVYINHEASRTSNDCYVCEIPEGSKLAPQRQLFEEMILVLDGRGSTTVWNDAGRRITFDWKAGAMFAIPLNCWHQHFNGSGQAGARYVAVTNAPPVINLYEDIEFVFNTGTTPARYLAFKHEVVSIRNAQGVPKAWISRRVGGDQIDYADEAPEIRRTFAEALTKNGLAPKMDAAYEAELADLPPLPARSVA